MQAGIIQHPASLVLPVDSSVSTPFAAGQLIGINSSGNAVLPDAAGANLFGIASADQDTDENTIDIFEKSVQGGGSAGGNSSTIGINFRLKITTGSIVAGPGVGAKQDVWLDGTNGGITGTKPGTTPVWIGVALESGGVGEMIMCAV